MNGKRLLACAALVGSILCFSGNFMQGGVAAASMPLMSLMFIKWGTAALPMLILANFIEKPDWRVVLKSWFKILLLSALGIAGYSFMFYEALGSTTPINASLINAFNPALIIIASVFFLKEKLTTKKVAGIAIAFCGVLWVLTGGNPAVIFSQKLNPGDIWMLGVICCWTGYNIVAHKGPSLPPLTSCALQMTFFTLAMAPYMLVHGVTLPSTTAASWSMAYIAIFPSAVAYALWNYGSKYIEPGVAGQSLNLVVPFTAIMTLLSGGSVSSVDLVGGVLVLGGVYLSLQATKPKNIPAASADLA
ncbi:TPA: DMT family transporter [Klebsiella quasipneumoniae]